MMLMRPAVLHSLQGYFLAAFLFLAIVFSLPIGLGVYALALDLPVNTNEALAGLVMPASAFVLLGKAGARLLCVAAALCMRGRCGALCACCWAREDRPNPHAGCRRRRACDCDLLHGGHLLRRERDGRRVVAVHLRRLPPLHPPQGAPCCCVLLLLAPLKTPWQRGEA